MKPSGKYPALYYQEATSEFDDDRIRIIYPDGRAEWRSFANYILEESKLECAELCCWYRSWRTFEQQIKAMREYDSLNGWPPAVFLGEIK